MKHAIPAPRRPHGRGGGKEVRTLVRTTQLGRWQHEAIQFTRALRVGQVAINMFLRISLRVHHSLRRAGASKEHRSIHERGEGGGERKTKGRRNPKGSIP